MTESVFVRIFDEDGSMLRPVPAENLGNLKFRLLEPPEGYDQLVEEWEFPPGTVVECRIGWKDHPDIIIALRRA